MVVIKIYIIESYSFLLQRDHKGLKDNGLDGLGRAARTEGARGAR